MANQAIWFEYTGLNELKLLAGAYWIQANSDSP